MTDFAVICYRDLCATKKSYPTYSIYYRLLANSKLIFKGGASIGKYIIKKRDDAYDQFIRGGDNDMSIVLAAADVDLPLTINTIEQIGQVLFNIIEVNIHKYHLVELIAPFAERDDIESCPRRSYYIRDYMTVDKDEEYLKSYYPYAVKSCIYQSSKLVDFSINSSRQHFILNRIKWSYLLNNKYMVSGELLDMSIKTPLSTPNNYTYNRVNPFTY